MKHPPCRIIGPSVGLAFALAALAALAAVAIAELQTARLQSRWLHGLVRDAGFTVEPDASDTIRFPGAGPYDRRLGYHDLPALIERAQRQGYAVAAQARLSPRLLALHGHGLFVPYREKNQAGLAVDLRAKSFVTCVLLGLTSFSS